jgi:hypothetical protein
MSSGATPSTSGSSMRAIFAGGFAAGVCDYVFALAYFHAQWDRLARRIASGALGHEMAFSAGAWVVPLGIVAHFVVATGAAAVFVLACRRWPALLRFWLPPGLAFGVVVYFVMSWVIVPGSAITYPAYPPRVDWGSLVGHMFVVGLPIAAAARWLAPRSRN